MQGTPSCRLLLERRVLWGDNLFNRSHRYVGWFVDGDSKFSRLMLNWILKLTGNQLKDLTRGTLGITRGSSTLPWPNELKLAGVVSCPLSEDHRGESCSSQTGFRWVLLPGILHYQGWGVSTCDTDPGYGRNMTCRCERLGTESWNSGRRRPHVSSPTLMIVYTPKGNSDRHSPGNAMDDQWGENRLLALSFGLFNSNKLWTTHF